MKPNSNQVQNKKQLPPTNKTIAPQTRSQVKVASSKNIKQQNPSSKGNSSKPVDDNKKLESKVNSSTLSLKNNKNTDNSKTSQHNFPENEKEISDRSEALISKLNTESIIINNLNKKDNEENDGKDAIITNNKTNKDELRLNFKIENFNIEINSCLSDSNKWKNLIISNSSLNLGINQLINKNDSFLLKHTINKESLYDYDYILPSKSIKTYIFKIETKKSMSSLEKSHEKKGVSVFSKHLSMFDEKSYFKNVKNKEKVLFDIEFSIDNNENSGKRTKVVVENSIDDFKLKDFYKCPSHIEYLNSLRKENKLDFKTGRRFVNKKEIQLKCDGRNKENHVKNERRICDPNESLRNKAIDVEKRLKSNIDDYYIRRNIY